ncbi:unnamed protein product [Rotaria socialis]|uniref:DOMON domain-containing protein n=1 Tax=Rotaria socialis TaxID=392032 RepID=A0A817WX24_9BILA|nr:unnamed protein product [Rotaria socialis]CAF4782613.1 unnamed protein product [Rotaria socialis]
MYTHIVWFSFFSFVILSADVVQQLNAISSPIPPYTNYTYATELQPNLADLWWSIDDLRKEITFEFHINTTGWIALGISPAGGMIGADIGLGWIDQSGQLHFEDRYAYGFYQPMVDNTTQDWFGLQGREVNGWTAIQFKRLLDTCDIMDYPIKSGTNIVIYAYSLEDPVIIDGKATIRYHGDRRYTRAIPLQSYANPPPESKFSGLDYFDFQLRNYSVPPNETTYHCTVYKIPARFPKRRHAVAHKTIIDPANIDIVHHMLMYECNPSAVFDDKSLPSGICDDLGEALIPCSSNIATGWAVGGDYINEFPEVAGYPVGGDFEIKYYVIQMHYNNIHQMSNRTDSSGMRFYLGNQLRQYDIGYLTLGQDSDATAIAIPPHDDRLVIDSYCPTLVTQNIPPTGITVVAAFPHTHLQGRTVWTKIVRNNKAVQYLFNADAYTFNYQFQNRLPQPITLYPGDELATRCIYSTTNKSDVTLGGEATRNEMCLHMFTYYPRMNNLHVCSMTNSREAWAQVTNNSIPLDYNSIVKWLTDRQWTTQSIVDWQTFYNSTSKTLIYDNGDKIIVVDLPKLPTYEDFEPYQCKKNATDAGTSSRPFELHRLLKMMKMIP